MSFFVQGVVSDQDQAATADLVGIPESRAGILTMLDYASLMRGLELLPHRRADVLEHFELDEKQGQPEIDRWTHWLETHPSDQAECAHMAERMSDYWRRWDASNPEKSERAVDEEVAPDPKNASLELMAKLSAGLETLPNRRVEVFVALGAHTHDEHVDLQIALDRLVSGPELDLRRFLALRTEATLFWQLWLSPPMLSLVDYARLVLDLDRASPKEIPSVHRAHRLDRVTADRELSLWKKRLLESNEELLRYEQVREQLVRSANAPVAAATPPMHAGAPAPMTARAVTGSIFTRTPLVSTPAVATAPTMPFISPPASVVQPAPASEPPPIGLLEYTVLCLQLELDEARAELHYRRLGLVEQDRRDLVHAYWQNRFAIDPAARKEWIDQARRLRINWQGSRK